MKTAKVKITIELDLPVDTKDEVYKFNAESSIRQTVFDGVTHYVICQHLIDSTKWFMESKENKRSTEYSIHRHHQEWANILRAAKVNYDIELPK